MEFELPRELTIAGAAELKRLLLDALAAAPELELGAAGVCEVDVAGLQVLCAARRTALARGARLTLRPGPSEALAQAVRGAGLGRAADERWLLAEGDHG